MKGNYQPPRRVQEGISCCIFFFSQCENANELQYQNVGLGNFIDKNSLQHILYCVKCLWLIDYLFLQVTKQKIFNVKGKTMGFMKNNKSSVFVQVFEERFISRSFSKKKGYKKM